MIIISVYYIEEKNNRSDRYVCIKNGKKFSYSVKVYGRFAKDLAFRSDKTAIRYNNIIIKKKKYSILKLISKKYGEVDVKIDTEDIEKISKYRWFLSGDPPYVVSKKCQIRFLHKFIMCDHIINKNTIIDHKNRNPLDCRKKNLREATYTTNNQNRSLPKNNKSGIMGIYETSNSWVASWYDEKHIKHQKYFSKKKYKNAKELAKKIRKLNTKHYKKVHIIKIKYKI